MLAVEVEVERDRVGLAAGSSRRKRRLTSNSKRPLLHPFRPPHPLLPPSNPPSIPRGSVKSRPPPLPRRPLPPLLRAPSQYPFALPVPQRHRSAVTSPIREQ